MLEEGMLRDVLLVTGGFDEKKASQVMLDVLEALSQQAAALRIVDYQKLAKTRPGDLAKAIHNTTRVVDELGRFMKFATGGADSRPDLSSLLKLLTDEQLLQIEAWKQEAIAKRQG